MMADVLLALGFLAIGLWLGFGAGRVYEREWWRGAWQRAMRPAWPRRKR